MIRVLRAIKILSMATKSERNSSPKQRRITPAPWRYGISKAYYLIFSYECVSNSTSPNRYEIEHASAIPYDIETSKDFVRSVAFGIEGSYEDPKACLSSVIQYCKDFTAGWQWDRRPQINSRVTLSTSNVGLPDCRLTCFRYSDSNC